MRARYRVGCAGMFAMGMDYGVRDELDALMAACGGPVGCEVLDTQTGEWIGPYCQEDADDIEARYEARQAQWQEDRDTHPDLAQAAVSFFVDEELGYEHDKADPDCGACWSGYPKRCETADCPGLVHAEFGDENMDCDYWLYTQCDACGQPE